MEAEGRDAQLRVSDAERHAVAEVLRQAAGEGRLDLEELEERLEAAYKAKTYGDLVPLTADLPAHPAGLPVPAAPRSPTLPATSHASSFAVMSETRRAGAWKVGPTHTAFALMGSVVLDLREAQLEGPEVTINASAVMGSIEVVVDAATHVVVDGLGVMGDFSEARSRVPAEVTVGSPVVRVRGLALMGAVNVRRKGPPRQLRGRR